MEQEQITKRTKNGGHYFFLHNRLFELQYPRRSKPYLIAIYAYLCRRADADQICWPSQTLISRETGISIRKVKSVIKDLEKGRLICVKRTRNGHKTNNTYCLTHYTDWKVPGAHHALRSAYQTPIQRRTVPPNNTHINKVDEIKDLMREKWGRKINGP